jgi:hypothetical protein
VGTDTSRFFQHRGALGTETHSSKPVNFKVYNKSTQKFIEFAFLEYDTSGGVGKFSARPQGISSLRDRIVFLEQKTEEDTAVTPTWWFYLLNANPFVLPQPGDTANVSVFKPFLSADVFRFVAKKGYTDLEQAKADLNRIK